MYYKKPKGVTYTQMAMYVDANAYSDDNDIYVEERIFKYLYFIVHMLSRKAGYFKRNADYDEFSLYLAASVFLRYKNPKQFELNEDGTPKLKKIKSCLNYIKKIIYPRKVNFEQEYYSQALSKTPEKDDTVYYSNYEFSERLSETIEAESMVDFQECLNDVAKTAKAYLKNIPYKKDPVMMKNIYISCMLTISNSMTLSGRALRRIKNMKRDVINNPDALERVFRKEKRTVILYHLDDSMHDYIYVLANEVKHAMAKDLSYSLDTYIPANTGLNATAVVDINSGNASLQEEDYS